MVTDMVIYILYMATNDGYDNAYIPIKTIIMKYIHDYVL